MKEKILTLAQQQLGYLEKKTNAMLEDKTANAGSANYTKYARDLDAVPGFYNGKKNGYPWCDVFVDWLFVTCFGAEKAKEMLCQPGFSYGAGCGYSARYYKEQGRFYEPGGEGEAAPQPGDQIFFWNAGRSDVAHTGLVVAVDGDFVHTIEGNTSTSSGVVSNGGGVWQKQYGLGNSQIYGYGRPKYDEDPVEVAPGKGEAATEEAAPYSREAFVRDVQRATGAAADGIPGPETLGKTPTVSQYKNPRHSVVAAVQRRLAALGYTQVGIPDGIAGPKFTLAVKAFQADHGCVTDGELTARCRSWQCLLWEVGT